MSSAAVSRTMPIARKLVAQSHSNVSRTSASRSLSVLSSRPQLSSRAQSCRHNIWNLQNNNNNTTSSKVFGLETYFQFSTKAENADEEKAETTPEEEVVAEETETTTTTDEEAAAKPAEPTKEEQLEQQVKDLRDQLLRSLAEQENTRRIAKRDVESARNFAVSSFAKSLLDTSDNLSRALEAVPEELRENKEAHPELANLFEGIKMTDNGLTKAFERNGLKKFGDAGEKFDPNMHEALYEYPDPTKDAGTVGQVMKTGFTLNGRVIRPAEVGVVKSA
jgi:molecular chaperone GrpE